MIKEPSIHITKSSLVKVLNGLFNINDQSPLSWDCEDLANEILKRGKRYTISSRTLIIKDISLLKKAKNVTTSSMEHTLVFTKQLTLYRRSLKHRIQDKYDENHKDWASVKKITEQIEAFSEEFDLSFEKGCQYYIKYLHEKTGKFIIPFWLNQYDYVISLHKAKNYILHDKTPELTKEAYLQYQQLLIDKIGQTTDYEKKPLDYQHFIKVVEASNEIGCKPTDYIKAQFKALEWKNTYPEPAALNYPKSREYVLKYLFENNILITKNQVPVPKVDWKLIKKAKK